MAPITTSHLLRKPLTTDSPEGFVPQAIKDAPIIVGRPDAGVPQMVARWAAESPDALALTSGAEAMTYGELDQTANQLAHHLITLGVGPDSIVGLCLERSLQGACCALGILKTGAAY